MRLILFLGRLLIALALLSMMLVLVSCTFATRSDLSADGSQSRQIYAQLGGKGAYAGGVGGQGSMVVQADNEKSFGQAMTAAGAAVAAYTWGAVEQARSAATVSTTNTATSAAAATEQARISASASTAKTLGSNPEANVPAVEAVGRLFKR
jgi:hypothetical protein